MTRASFSLSTGASQASPSPHIAHKQNRLKKLEGDSSSQVTRIAARSTFLEHAPVARVAPVAQQKSLGWSRLGVIDCCSDPPFTRAGGQDDGSLHKLPQMNPCISMHRVKGSRAGVQSTVQQRAVLSNRGFEQPLRALRCLQSMLEQLFQAPWQHPGRPKRLFRAPWHHHGLRPERPFRAPSGSRVVNTGVFVCQNAESSLGHPSRPRPRAQI